MFEGKSEGGSARGKAREAPGEEARRESKGSEDDAALGGWTQVHMADVELGQQIGGGGFALVYRGNWKGRAVALKTLFDPRADEEVKQEFMDELFVMSRLDHPHIVTLFGACVTPPNLCMVMELCERSLFELLHTDGEVLSEKEAVRMACEVASALEYMHEQSPAVIHRDIKSLNVLVTADRSVKLCDFGLVSTTITSAGTPAYMAPELLCSGLFSKSVDVYAFAVLLWEMFTASIPFANWDPHDIRDFVRKGKRLQLPHSGCPRQCGKLIERCWDSDPDRRPAFASIRRALTRIHSTLRDTSHLEEMTSQVTDSFDALSASVSHK